MNRKTILTLGTTALLSLGLLGGVATMAAADSHKSGDDMAELQALLAAPGSIAQAITAAETQSGGKAMSAEFEDHGADVGWYEVEIVMADGTVAKLLVNPADGTVKAADARRKDDDKAHGETDGDGAENESN